MSVCILGIGTALPEHAVTKDNALKHARAVTCRNSREERVIGELYRRTAIENRFSVLAGTFSTERETPFFPESDAGGPSTESRMERYCSEAPALALVAANRALSASNTAVNEITHLITVSCTGFFAPGVDVELMTRLPLSPETARTNVGFMGCHGMINALKVARDIALADSKRRVLVSATELCSLHFQYAWNSDNVIANSLFADGSAAVVLAAGKPGGNQLTVDFDGSTIAPGSKSAMTWRVGDNGFMMTLSNEVPAYINEYLPDWLNGLLARHSMNLSDIKNWVVHPGGRRILDSVEASLGLPPEALAESRFVLEQQGNMSSPTVIFVLERMLQKGSSGPFILLGFGPGLAIESLMLNR